MTAIIPIIVVFIIFFVRSKIKPFIVLGSNGSVGKAVASFLLKNGSTPASFSFLFSLFKETLQFLQQIIVKKRPSSIQCRDSNPQPFEHELSPITTRPRIASFGRVVASYIRDLRFEYSHQQENLINILTFNCWQWENKDLPILNRLNHLLESVGRKQRNQMWE